MRTCLLWTVCRKHSRIERTNSILGNTNPNHTREDRTHDVSAPAIAKCSSVSAQAFPLTALVRASTQVSRILAHSSCLPTSKSEWHVPIKNSHLLQITLGKTLTQRLRNRVLSHENENHLNTRTRTN